jgi:Tfp pilus assembly major pilin PilA
VERYFEVVVFVFAVLVAAVVAAICLKNYNNETAL